MCEQRLKGIVDPLAMKAHNVLDLVHQTECVTYAGALGSSSLPLVDVSKLVFYAQLISAVI